MAVSKGRASRGAERMGMKNIKRTCRVFGKGYTLMPSERACTGCAGCGDRTVCGELGECWEKGEKSKYFVWKAVAE